MFSKKILGDGFAVEPINGEIYSPIKGKVISIFPSKHAIGLVDELNQLELLVHIGIDTVELQGEPFEIFCKVGDRVDENTLLAKVDLDLLEKENKQKDIIVVVMDDNNISLDIIQPKSVEKGEIVGNIIIN